MGTLDAQQEGLILTEEQLKALERKKEEEEARGEIETEHPGYLLAQDTYTKVAFAKLISQPFCIHFKYRFSGLTHFPNIFAQTPLETHNPK